ncbi:hypothetical protein [Christiangramia sabulilitoris]|uniref:Lipocalin-like domain-containing protein n=1 Tax=Christiangramia sabulilitoris TaxID=2583991 RepID=A0A550I885_9FLAO|nr:hypothetical protein [Christiangramia sabulilitoris]TRO67038.1 hypothetical protein FGM01_03875 [Christiangramia sabulilitoris]
MKKLILILFSLSILSCTENTAQIDSQDLSIINFPQKWTLYKMTGRFIGSEITGSDMAYQEYYIFNANNTFSKIRISEDREIMAEGSYRIDYSNEGIAYLLNYSIKSDIIENCSGDNEEFLYLDPSKTTLLSSWWSCDGPGLFYQQVPIE